MAMEKQYLLLAADLLFALQSIPSPLPLLRPLSSPTLSVSVFNKTNHQETKRNSTNQKQTIAMLGATLASNCNGDSLSSSSAYFFSAPASPTHFLLSSSPAHSAYSSIGTCDLQQADFKFDLAARSMSTAEELFVNGQIRPGFVSTDHAPLPPSFRNLLFPAHSRQTPNWSPWSSTYGTTSASVSSSTASPPVHDLAGMLPVKFAYSHSISPTSSSTPSISPTLSSLSTDPPRRAPPTPPTPASRSRSDLLTSRPPPPDLSLSPLPLLTPFFYRAPPIRSLLLQSPSPDPIRFAPLRPPPPPRLPHLTPPRPPIGSYVLLG